MGIELGMQFHAGKSDHAHTGQEERLVLFLNKPCLQYRPHIQAHYRHQSWKKMFPEGILLERHSHGGSNDLEGKEHTPRH